MSRQKNGIPVQIASTLQVYLVQRRSERWLILTLGAFAGLLVKPLVGGKHSGTNTCLHKNPKQTYPKRPLNHVQSTSTPTREMEPVRSRKDLRNFDEAKVNEPSY
jgi:hypothetical protein